MNFSSMCNDSLQRLHHGQNRSSYERVLKTLEAINSAQLSPPKDLIYTDDAFMVHWSIVTLHILYQAEEDLFLSDGQFNKLFVLQAYGPNPTSRYYADIEVAVCDLKDIIS